MKALLTLILIDHGEKLWIAAIAAALLLPAAGLAVPGWLVACAIAPFILLPLALLIGAS